MSLVRYSDELFLVSSVLLCCELVYIFVGRDVYYCGIFTAVGRVVSVCVRYANLKNLYKDKKSSSAY
jgi:hypothetical protein